MEVNKKYKEVDKKAEVIRSVLHYVELKEINKIIPVRVDAEYALANTIDAIYKEDSKQIDRVEFNKPLSGFRIEVSARYITMCGMALNKEEVGKIADILTTIKNQLE